jgi:hypothetical protein
MESLFSFFLLFIAAMAAILTYMLVPNIPIVVLTSASAIALAAGVWWHWVQFSQEYRTSTWQEQLRNYSSYVMVLVVILLSYGFYVMAYSGSSLQSYATAAVNSARDASYRVASTIASGTARAATNVQNAATAEATPSVNRNSRNRPPNILV